MRYLFAVVRLPSNHLKFLILTTSNGLYQGNKKKLNSMLTVIDLSKLVISKSVYNSNIHTGIQYLCLTRFVWSAPGGQLQAENWGAISDAWVMVGGGGCSMRARGSSWWLLLCPSGGASGQAMCVYQVDRRPREIAWIDLVLLGATHVICQEGQAS
jgi:hypothetical protein